MEAENIVLKSENAELKNLSKLMQHQMNESLDTSKRYKNLLNLMSISNHHYIIYGILIFSFLYVPLEWKKLSYSSNHSAMN